MPLRRLPEGIGRPPSLPSLPETRCDLKMLYYYIFYLKYYYYKVRGWVKQVVLVLGVLVLGVRVGVRVRVGFDRQLLVRSTLGSTLPAVRLVDQRRHLINE
jgi:hypothetical protein